MREGGGPWARILPPGCRWAGPVLLGAVAVWFAVTANVVRAALALLAGSAATIVAGWVGRSVRSGPWVVWPAAASLALLTSRAAEHPVSWQPSFGLLIAGIGSALLTAAADDGALAVRALREVTSICRGVGGRVAAAVGRVWRQLDRTSWVAGALSCAATASHVLWWAHQRAGFGLEHDEARILTSALRMQDGFAQRGLRGFVAAWQSDPVVPPILPTLASPVTAITDDPVWLSLAIVPFTTLLMLTGFTFARRLGGRVSGMAALAVLAVVPGVLWFSRVYEQIVPAAALWLFTLFSVVRSDGLRSRPWRLVAGVALGVALLTRAMLIAFVFVLLTALLLQWLASERTHRADPRHLLEFSAVAALIASSWWWPNAASIIAYLRDGSQPAAGSSALDLSSRKWAKETEIAIELLGSRYTLWALAAMLVVGTIVPLVRSSRVPVPRRLRQVLAGPEGFLLWATVLGHGLLVAVGHDFWGFGLLNTGPFVVLCCSALRVRAARALLPVLAVSLGALLPSSMAPEAGWMPVLVYGSETDGLEQHDRGWPEFDRAVLQRCRELVGPDTEVVIGAATGRILSNGLTIGVRAALEDRTTRAFNLRLDEAALDGGPVERVNCALTADPPTESTVAYELDTVRLEATLMTAGYRLAGELDMPDGGRLRVWTLR